MFTANLYICAFFALHLVPHGSFGDDFGYDESNGPSNWGKKYQHCVGKHQSPIDIQEHAVKIVRLPPLEFKDFDRKPRGLILKNNGHTVVLWLEADKKPTITGGPLIGDYEFVQFHFHWGANDGEGSENTINNSSFPMELHIVLYQKDYGSFDEALHHPDGLAVLSFLFSTAKKGNPNYKILVDSLAYIENPQTSTTIKNPPTLNKLLADDLSVYFTYGGSLTTPPCSEVVTWIEFKNTIPLTAEQINKFRKLSSGAGLLTRNFRPVQPLHGRTIRMHQDISDPDLPSARSQENSGSNIHIAHSFLMFFTFFVFLQVLFNHLP